MGKMEFQEILKVGGLCIGWPAFSNSAEGSWNISPVSLSI